MQGRCSVKLRLPSDRRHLDEMLHAIVARAEELELTYEISDSPEVGPLGLPVRTQIEFGARSATRSALAAEVDAAIERAGLAERFQCLP